MTSADEIASVCDELKTMLLEKNKAYGDSALSPVRVFSKAPTDEQICVRLDDKISRLMRGEAAGEDPEWDLMGYLVLLRVAKRRVDRALATQVDLRSRTPAPLGGTFEMGRKGP